MKRQRKEFLVSPDVQVGNAIPPSMAKGTHPLTIPRLQGRRMRVVSTDPVGVVSGQTILEFEQTNDMVSARYRGGTILDGYLLGTLDSAGASLRFCYVQVDLHGSVDAGSSICTISHLKDGRLLLREEFQWLTRPGSGTNVFEEMGTGDDV